MNVLYIRKDRENCGINQKFRRRKIKQKIFNKNWYDKNSKISAPNNCFDLVNKCFFLLKMIIYIKSVWCLFLLSKSVDIAVY
jgi:hypothetical protein